RASCARTAFRVVVVLGWLSDSWLLLLSPDRAREILEFTPFALVGQVTFIDWAGAPLAKLTNGGEIFQGFAVYGAAGTQIAVLAVWAVALSWLSVRCMKWETNR